MWCGRNRSFCVFCGLAVAIGVACMATARSQAPDKATIIFISDRGGGAFWLMDPDGQDQRPIEAGQGGGAMAWSPDGRKIAFASVRQGKLDVWVMDADGGNPAKLTSARNWSQWPDWFDPAIVPFVVSSSGRLGMD